MKKSKLRIKAKGNILNELIFVIDDIGFIGNDTTILETNNIESIDIDKLTEYIQKVEDKSMVHYCAGVVRGTLEIIDDMLLEKISISEKERKLLEFLLHNY